MNLFQQVKLTALVSALTIGLTACGGGGGGGGSADNGGGGAPPPADPPPPPVAAKVNMNDMVIEMATQGSVTMPDGFTYSEETGAIELSEFEWDVDSDVDYVGFDDLFEQ